MDRRRTLPRIAVTVGDPNGIGPEIVLRSVRHRSVRSACVPVLVGPGEAFVRTAVRLGIPFRAERRTSEALPRGDRTTILLDTREHKPFRLRPGVISADAGRVAHTALLQAVRLARTGSVDAVVTAPVAKQALHRAGILEPGQTEILQRACGVRTVAMILAAPRLRVGLITIHAPLAQVPRLFTPALLRDRLRVLYGALRQDWGILRPRIALLGINPHAGEDGHLGTEERRVMRPVLRLLRKEGLVVDGPFPADAFFGRMDWSAWDLVAAAYHDQGLIPLKLLAQGRGVNITAGLPIIRTSPDHGTAFDRAEKGGADPRSMIEAILLAVRFVRTRARNRRGQ